MKNFIDKRGQNCWLQVFVDGNSTDLNPDQGYQNQPARRIIELPEIDNHIKEVEVRLTFTQLNTDVTLVMAPDESHVLADRHVINLSPQIKGGEALPYGQIHYTGLHLLLHRIGWSEREIYDENYDRYRLYCAANGYAIPPRRKELV